MRAKINTFQIPRTALFDVYVFVLNSNSLTKTFFAHMCIRICYKENSCQKREVVVSNSKSMVLRNVHVYLCALNS